MSIRQLSAPGRMGVPAGMVISDRAVVEQLKRQRAATGADRYDEVWDGVYVMNPLPNNEHQDIVTALSTILRVAIDWTGLGKVYAGANVSDLEEDWVQNYRGPDVVVCLASTRARDLGTHWTGGPDFLVEVVSRGDGSREKLPFYADLRVREALIVDRDPWQLELYRLRKSRLVKVGSSALNRPKTLLSVVLPLSFRLISGEDRPRIEVTHCDGEQRWLA